jgi:hypothetical protein
MRAKRQVGRVTDASIIRWQQRTWGLSIEYADGQLKAYEVGSRREAETAYRKLSGLETETGSI